MMAVDLRTGVDLPRLRAVVAEACRRAVATAQPVLASLICPAPALDPLALFACGEAGAEERMLFMHPTEHHALAGVGTAWMLQTAGAGRFEQASKAWRDLIAGACVDDSASDGQAGPTLLGGFSFDPLRPTTPLWQGYPDGLLMLPRYLLAMRDGLTWLTVSAVVTPGSDVAEETARLALGYETMLARAATLPARGREGDAEDLQVDDVLSVDHWQSIVAAATRQMQAGGLEKVVLARACRVQSARDLAVVPTLARLRAAYPSCFIFAVARGERCFLGATPERLVRLRERRVQAMSLAGSIARGATPDEDRILGLQLLASAKDRAEHGFVVRALTAALADVCTSVAAPAAPELLKVRNVQHLLTTVAGRGLATTTVLDLVGRLHPTPAVGGYPRTGALELIREREELDRGWYAGPIGWVDARGDGEFAVALRSALVHGAEATLFAGCGIVADSDPAAEYAESCLKLRPMLAALGGQP